MAEENKVEENIDAGQEAPVDAPEGTAALPLIPLSRIICVSNVGTPLLSSIS